MCKHEEKYCPRCNKMFECKAGSITQCQCNTVKLTEEERSFIEKKYSDCLCLSCLDELKQQLVLQQNN